MNPLAHAFRNAMAAISGSDFSKLRKRGLDDFLSDSIHQTDTAVEIASRALFELCERDGGDLDKTVAIAVITFLQSVSANKPTDQTSITRCATDLKQIMINPGTIEAYSELYWFSGKWTFAGLG